MGYPCAYIQSKPKKKKKKSDASIKKVVETLLLGFAGLLGFYLLIPLFALMDRIVRVYAWKDRLWNRVKR
jgi:hypothetical protein